MGPYATRQSTGSIKSKAPDPGPKKKQMKKSSSAPSRANWARERGIILEEEDEHMWWKYATEVLSFMFKWLLTVDVRKRQETKVKSPVFKVEDMRDMIRKLLVVLVYHPSWWESGIKKRKGMFSSKKRTDYQWDPSIPLPSVNSNSSNSETRGNMKELKVVIDYMIPRVVTEVLPYLRFKQLENVALVNRIIHHVTHAETFDVEDTWGEMERRHQQDDVKSSNRVTVKLEKGEARLKKEVKVEVPEKLTMNVEKVKIKEEADWHEKISPDKLKMDGEQVIVKKEIVDWDEKIGQEEMMMEECQGAGLLQMFECGDEHFLEHFLSELMRELDMALIEGEVKEDISLVDEDLDMETLTVNDLDEMLEKVSNHRLVDHPELLYCSEEQQEEMDVAFLEDEGPIIGEDVYFGNLYESETPADLSISSRVQLSSPPATSTSENHSHPNSPETLVL